MKPPSLSIPLTAVGLLAGAVGISSAHAQTAEGTLEQVEVRASRSADAQAAEAVDQARQELARRAGATAVVDAATFTAGRAATAVDALSFAPGVLAQTRHG